MIRQCGRTGCRRQLCSITSIRVGPSKYAGGILERSNSRGLTIARIFESQLSVGNIKKRTRKVRKSVGILQAPAIEMLWK